MEPGTLAPGARKPSAWWVVITLAAGALGALSAIAVGGKGTYDIAPFKVELRAWPGFQGKTELAVRVPPSVGGGVGLPSGTLPFNHAEAGTHKSPIVFRATIVGVSSDLASSDLASVSDPFRLAQKLAEDGKDARTSFGLKLGALAISGALGAGALVSLAGMRWRRVAGSLFAGVLTFALIGLLVQQTYDKAEFQKTRFVQDEAAGRQ